jgi:AcrR family transcriptional regulator
MATVTMLSMPTNRHELRRRATRDALRQSALAKFAERGFDQVTVAEVSEEVGVTERTFYRHFPTKESILFQDYETRLDWLSAALAMRPTGEPVFESVQMAVRSFPHDIEIVRQAAILRTSLISGDRVADHMRTVQASFASVFADFVRSRKPHHADVELIARVSGNVLAAAMVAAVEVWGTSECKEDIDSIMNRSIDLVRSGLDPIQ